MELEKFFETKHRNRKEWKSREGNSDLELYGWLGCACADDYKQEGPVGEYLRKVIELKTISQIQATRQPSEKVAMLTFQLDSKNKDLKDLMHKHNEKTLSLTRILEEKDWLHHAYNEETKKLKQQASANIQKVLDTRERLTLELEVKQKEIDSWTKKLNMRDALTEHERQKLDEEKEKNAIKTISLQKASEEQKKADENVLLSEEKKEEVLNKMLELERQSEEKHEAEMEREELKGKLSVMKHLADQDDSSVKEKMKELEEKLEEKDDHLSFLQDQLNQLHTKEQLKNYVFFLWLKNSKRQL